MLRLGSIRLHACLLFLAISCLFTASVGGVQANVTPPGSFSPVQVLAAKTKKPTKTPKPAKTRKAKRTKTPAPSITSTAIPISFTPTATVAGTENSTPSATSDDFETPTPTALVIEKTAPAPKQTRRAEKTAVKQQTRRARKTARAKQTRRATRRATSPVELPTATPRATRYKEQIDMDAATGGTFEPEFGNVILQVPPNALKRSARLTFIRKRLTPHGDGPNGQTVFNQFSLTARPLANLKRKMRKFRKNLTLKIRYAPELLGSVKPENLMAVYWDVSNQQWRPLETWVDPGAQTLNIRIKHFTDFGLVDAPEVSNFIPGLESFQTDLFSGAAGYSLPVQMPAGQGGLVPRLSLSYSSTGVDMINSTATTSHVGLGWSLDTGYIARSSPNRYTLSLNGSGNMIVEGADGKYHTSKEKFWRIERSGNTGIDPGGDTWTVTTTDGTKYTFGQVANALALDLRKNIGTGTYSDSYYQFLLYQVQDTHGNRIVYSYNHDTYTCNGVTLDRAVYVQSIEYNSDGTGGYRTRLGFVYSDRSDWNLYYSATSCGPEPHMRKKLDAINVKTHDDASPAEMQFVRKYEFHYDYSLLPGVPNYQGGDDPTTWGKLALRQINIYGNDEASTLPPYTFTYKPNGRLNIGTNSLGGSVNFDYNNETAGPSADKYTQDYATWTCGETTCSVPSYAFWQPSGSGFTFDVRQDPQNQWALAVQAPVTPSQLQWRLVPYVPTGNYELTNTLMADQGNTQVQFRLWDYATNSETNLTDWLPLSTTTSESYTTSFSLPADSQSPQIRLYSSSTSGTAKVFIRETFLQQLSTHNRVVEKIVSDGLGSSHSWKYQYVGIATNDAAHSLAAQQSDPRVPMYSEFRGHSKVTVTDPLLNTTEHEFAQDDIYAGKALNVTQRSGTSTLMARSLNTYDFNTFPTDVDFGVSGERIDFVKLATRINEQWDGQAAAVGERTDYTYDTYGNLTVTQEYSDTSTANLYRTTFREFHPNTTNNIIDKVARVFVTNASGTTVSETRHFYDGQNDHTQTPVDKGELTKIQGTANGTNFFDQTLLAYDSYGNVIEATDALGHKTTTTYDTRYNIFPKSVQPELIPETVNDYNSRMGVIIKTTDPNGAITTTEYDVFGRRTKVWAPSEQGYAATAEYSYCLPPECAQPRVRVRVRSDIGGAVSVTYQEAYYFYDGLGRVIQKQTQPETGTPILLNTAYDERGKVKWVSLPYQAAGTLGTYIAPDWDRPKTVTTYDALGRITLITHPDTTTTTTVFNQRLTTVTDANGHKKDFRRDPMGRTDRVREYQNNTVYATTTYGYDISDRLVDTFDHLGNNTHITYDRLGRKTAMDDPDMGLWGYAYDNAGNLKRQTDAKNQSLCFNYDALNRVTQKQARTGTSDCAFGTVSYTVTYGYDSITNGNKGYGRRTSMTDPSGSTAWTYDLEGQLISTSQTITGAPNNPYVTSSTFDAMGRARSMVYPGPNPETVNLTYNGQGLLETLGTFVSGASYNAAGQLTNVQFGNGSSTTYSYDPDNARITDIDTTHSGASRQDLHYTYDNVGNVLTMQDNVRAETTTYNYDDLDRLLTASANGSNPYSYSWEYDELGRMLTRTVGTTLNTYEYTDVNHVHARTKWNGQLQFAYDPNGNMQQLYGDVQTFDVENRLIRTAGGTTISFVYNGDGQRVSKTVSGTGGYTTYYVGRYYEVKDPDSGNDVIYKYYYFGSQRVAMKVDNTIYYLRGDHLGSTSVVLDNAGAVYSRRTYYPYGEVRTQQGSALPTDFTFTGQRFDVGELMDYGAREYDTTHAQFIQPDSIVPNPLDPQSLNRYSYVRNNPVNQIDPTGHSPEAPCQSWDNYCWEKRYYEAQGRCLNGNTNEWTRACEPTFADADIFAETVGALLGEAAQSIERNDIVGIATLEQRFQLLFGNQNAVNLLDAVLGAYMAVGEMSGYCNPFGSGGFCRAAFGNVLQTVVNRKAIVKCGADGCNPHALNDIPTIGGLLAGGCDIKCSQYQGLERWISGVVSFTGPGGDNYRAQFHIALSVAFEVFGGRYPGDPRFPLQNQTMFGAGNEMAAACKAGSGCISYNYASPGSSVAFTYFWNP